MGSTQEFDVIIIGAGPAGLSAARTATGLNLKTLLLEKSAGSGKLGHPCGGVIAPVPGFVTGRLSQEGLHFRELDIVIPQKLVIGMPAIQRFIGPKRHEFRATFPNRDDFPIAAIDKPALLRLMAEQAMAAGAELRFGSPVTGLLKEGGQIVGVRAHYGEIRSRVVLSAEGMSRHFSEAAGLYDHVTTEKPYAFRYVFIVNEELEAPAAYAHHIGQISTMGKRYTSVSTPAFGTVVIPAPGRASVYFSIFTDSPKVLTDESLWYYLEEYKRQDPRVSHLFAGAKMISRSGCRMSLRETPSKVVCDGFISVGDAVSPGGHLGILPCMFLGKQAARVAAQAIQASDLSAKQLDDYNRLFHGPILRGLNTETKIITSLAAMTDEEIDRICQTMSKVNLAHFFFGEWKPILVETIRWILTGLPLILRDWKLVYRMMSGKH